MPISKAWSTPPTSGSSSAPASASAISPATARPPPSLGEAAARAALDRCRLTPADIDLIILATSTPDNTFPATAVDDPEPARHARMASPSTCRRSAPASSMRWPRPTLYIRGGLAKRVLVIGAETFSRILDWNDRTTCVLFGDGAGAVVLEADEGEGTIADRGVLTAQPALRRLAQGQALRRRRPVDDRHGRPSADGGPRGLQARRRHDHRRDRGDASPQTGITADDIDWFVPHQANQAHHRRHRPRSSASPSEKVVVTVDLHGNTSAASIPLALCDGRRATAASSRAISCCSRRWAAASPGARCCSAGKRQIASPVRRTLTLARIGL